MIRTRHWSNRWSINDAIQKLRWRSAWLGTFDRLILEGQRYRPAKQGAIGSGYAFFSRLCFSEIRWFCHFSIFEDVKKVIQWVIMIYRTILSLKLLQLNLSHSILLMDWCLDKFIKCSHQTKVSSKWPLPMPQPTTSPNFNHANSKTINTLKPFSFLFPTVVLLFASQDSWRSLVKL